MLRNKETEVKNKLEVLSIYLLYILSVLIIYLTPDILGVILQLVLLLLFWRSKKDYFWLAFIFIIESEIGFLFAKIDSPHSFSLIEGSIFGNLYFSMIFLIIAFLKYYNPKSSINLFLSRNITLIVLYFLIQVLLFGVYKTTAAFRLLEPWLFIIVVPRIINDENNLVKFFNLIFSFVFLVILTQSFKIITGKEFSIIFGGVTSLTVFSPGGIDEVGHALRPVYGIFIPFLSVWGSIFFLTLRKHYFNKSYLHLILGLSIFSIFITATRSWLIAVLVVFVFYVILISRRKILSIVQIIITGFVIIMMIAMIPVLQKQTILALNRYETLGDFIQGDITAGGTSSRFDVRAERPLEGFKKNPIIGWGIGEEFIKYADGHIGYHTLLMSGGIIGFLLWMFLWLNYIYKMLQSYKYIKNTNPYKKIPLVLIAFLISILILHSSVMWFGYMVGVNNALIISLLFTLGYKIFVLGNHKSILRLNKSANRTEVESAYL